MQKFSATEYLLIDIANNFGKDKLNWDERLIWAYTHEDKLFDLVGEAESPACFYAAVNAYYQALAGDPIGYTISLDATASGMQILSALVCCPKSGKQCNLIFTGKREDGYTNIYQVIKKKTELDIIERPKVKKAVMTAFYGSEDVPHQVFYMDESYNAFIGTMEEETPGAWFLNEIIKALWDTKASFYEWRLPDNFHVHTDVMVKRKKFITVFGKQYEMISEEVGCKKKGKSLCPNIVHSIDGYVVREIERRCNYDIKQIKYLKKVLSQENNKEPKNNYHTEMVKTLWQLYLDSGMLSARILDYLHEDNLSLVDKQVIKDLIESMPQQPFQVLTIHDCFRVHPNYGNDIREQYRNLMVEICKSNLLNFILKDVTGKDLNIPKEDPEMWKQVACSEYAIC